MTDEQTFAIVESLSATEKMKDGYEYGEEGSEEGGGKGDDECGNA